MTTRAPRGARHPRNSASTIDARPISDPGHQADARADQRRAAAREEKLLGDIYEQGRKDATEQRRAAAAARSRERGASTARRVAQPAVRAAQQAVVSPGRNAAAFGGWIIGSMLVLILLYDFLSSVPTVTSAMRGVERGLSWLASPHKSITYAP